jgi:hypothetical protein
VLINFRNNGDSGAFPQTKLLKALKKFIRQNPEFAYNEDALKSADVYQEFLEVIQSEEFQKLVGCGVDTYMYGDAESVLRDILKGN